MNLPTSICATLDYKYPRDLELSNRVQHFLELFQHMNKLTIGSWFLKVTSKPNNHFIWNDHQAKIWKLNFRIYYNFLVLFLNLHFFYA